MVRGHVTFGVHKYLPPKKYTSITILRNSIERIISNYYYLRSLKQIHPELSNILSRVTLYEYVTREEFDLYEYLVLSQSSFYFYKTWMVFSTSNLQTRILAGNDAHDLDTAKIV